MVLYIFTSGTVGDADKMMANLDFVDDATDDFVTDNP